MAIIWRRQWHPTPVLLPGKSHGRRSLEGCSLWGLWESDTTERLHFHFSLSCIGEGNGSPLQCSCLENPREGGAWWAASMGSHRVRHDWSDLVVVVVMTIINKILQKISYIYTHSILPETAWLGHRIYVFKFDEYYQLSFKLVELIYTSVNIIWDFPLLCTFAGISGGDFAVWWWLFLCNCVSMSTLSCMYVCIYVCVCACVCSFILIPLSGTLLSAIHTWKGQRAAVFVGASL